MSFNATRWAWAQNVTPTQKLILLALSDCANEDHFQDGKWTAYPSANFLAEMTGLTERAVRKNLIDLVECSVIERSNGRCSRSCVYKFGRENEQKTASQTGTTFRNTESGSVVVDNSNRNVIPPDGTSFQANRNVIPRNRNDVPPNQERTNKGTSNDPSLAATSRSPKSSDGNVIENVGKRNAKGTRLEAGWQLPPEWEAWACNNGLTTEQARTEGDSFADYWRSKAGAGATKTDWEATWRNWIRKNRNFRRNTNGNTNQANDTRNQKPSRAQTRAEHDEACLAAISGVDRDGRRRGIFGQAGACDEGSGDLLEARLETSYGNHEWFTDL